uniref:Uncharacterized protein LOC102807771 n=1 Tax=Saccoglossus kowalevskii TaxID=10224 RepID=A0ABM0MIC7_SACKO|nr:PREDICTED: uncharacterized protein LOC102807771 [Saccoglossus kowalevskii]
MIDPLTYVSSSINDNIALTPNHLLHGRTLTSLPYIEVTDDEIRDPTYQFSDHREMNNRYVHLSRLHAQFWRRWSTEYLTALRERHPTTGSKGNTIKVRDVVIIHSDVDKRQKWHLGTVTKLVYGNDQLVRSAELNTANGPTNRPIHKLYPLEVVSKELTSPESNNQSDVGLPAETIQNIGLTADKARTDVTTTQMTGDTIPKRPTRDSAVAARIRFADLM